jgi:DNA polymerase III epsilon subunit-like protein
VIVHHNGDKFDLKKLNTRLIIHGLDPLPKIHTVDTLKEVRKVAAFTSNRLDYLAKTLVGAGKTHVDYQLWLDIMKGNKRAVRDMVAYNKVDVIRLEEVYSVLLPYMKSHPHIGAQNGESKDLSCRYCGSTHVKKNGTKHTAAGLKKQEIQCRDCHGYSVVRLA